MKKKIDTSKPVAEMTIREVRKAIHDLTGHVPREGAGERYLRRRLTDLMARAANGEDIRHKADSTVCSFSTTVTAKVALEEVIEEEREKGGAASSMTKLTNLALREWCERNGYKAQAAILGGE